MFSIAQDSDSAASREIRRLRLTAGDLQPKMHS